MEFELIPVKTLPKRNCGWGVKRFKKPDKYDFEGKYNVEGINIKKGKYL